MKRLNECWGVIQEEKDKGTNKTHGEVQNHNTGYEQSGNNHSKLLVTGITTGILTLVGTLIYAGSLESQVKTPSKMVEHMTNKPIRAEILLREFHHKISLTLSSLSPRVQKDIFIHTAFEEFQNTSTPEEWEQMIYFFQKQSALINQPSSNTSLMDFMKKKNLSDKELGQFGALLWQQNTVLGEQKKE